MRQKVVEKTRFAVVDAAGRQHVVVVRATLLLVESFDGSEWIEGLHSYTMATGGHVNLSDDGTLTLVSTGEVLRRA